MSAKNIAELWAGSDGAGTLDGLESVEKSYERVRKGLLTISMAVDEMGRGGEYRRAINDAAATLLDMRTKGEAPSGVAWRKFRAVVSCCLAEPTIRTWKRR